MSSHVIGSGREPFTEPDALSAAIWPSCTEPAFTGGRLPSPTGAILDHWEEEVKHCIKIKLEGYKWITNPRERAL